MTVVTNFENCPINMLNLNKFLYQTLLQNNLYTVKDVVFLTDEELLNIPGINKTALSVLKDSIEELNNPISIFNETENEDDFTMYQKLFPKATKDDTIKFNAGNKIQDDLNVEDTGLSARSKNIAHRLNLHTLKRLIGAKYNTIKYYPMCGKASFEELTNYLQQVCIVDYKSANTNKAIEDILPINILDESYLFYTKVLSAFYTDLYGLISTDELKMNLNKVHSLIVADTTVKPTSLLANTPVINELYAHSNVVTIIRQICDSIIRAHQDGISSITLMNKLPVSFVKCSLFDSIFDSYLKINSVSMFNHKYYYNYDSIFDYVSKLKNKDHIKILEDRFSGLTYQQLGDKYEITKQRIDQIISKYLKARPPVYEDRFLYWYDTYNLDCSLFCSLFKITEKVYMYLTTVSRARIMDKKELRDMVNDPFLDGEIQERINKILNKDKIVINNDLIDKKRWSIFTTVLKNNHSENKVKVKKALEEFVIYCEANNLKELCKNLSEHHTEQYIASANDLLLCGNHTVRYCSLTEDQVKKLLESLPFNKYKNLCISADRLFIDHPNLMKTYKIKSANELHNIINKYQYLVPQYQISCSRMPLLNIGAVNRKQQMLDILNEVDPCSRQELLQIAYDRFGINKGTFDANWLSIISDYYYEGIFSKKHLNIEKEPIKPRSLYTSPELNLSYFMSTGNPDIDNSRTAAVTYVKAHYKQHTLYPNYFINPNDREDIYYVNNANTIVYNIPVRVDTHKVKNKEYPHKLLAVWINDKRCVKSLNQFLRTM